MVQAMATPPPAQSIARPRFFSVFQCMHQGHDPEVFVPVENNRRFFPLRDFNRYNLLLKRAIVGCALYIVFAP